MAGPSDATALILQMSADISGIQKQMNSAVGIVDSSSAKMVLRSKEAAAAIEKSFGTINVENFGAMLAKTASLQDKLTAAQTAGNAAEVRSIREQIALQGALQKAATAQLETQLAIARATGNKGQIAQLTEALALQSQLSKFQAVGLTGSKALHEAEAAVVALSAAERAAEGANVGKALDKVFDSSKLAIMEEGAAKIRVFGSALEPLGPIGIGVAAAIGAVAIAGEEARKAMEWADDLDRTAKKLGVTTTSLQELDYASVATSIGLQQGREALDAFNIEVGKFETHTGDERLKKWASAIKLSRDEVNRTVDPVQKLSLVMEHIAQLRDAQSRTAAAKAFGLEGLLPIINEGTEGIEKFIGKMKEARENDSIVDPRAIKELAELNGKVEEFAYRIGVDFKKVFIELAPAIEKVAEFIERCTHALSGFLGEIPDAIRGVEALIEKLPHIPTGVHVSQDLKDAAGNAAVNLLPGGRQAADALGAARELFRAAVQEGRAAKLGDKVKDLLSGKPVDLTGSDFDPALRRQGTGEQLNFDKAKKGPADETLTFDKAARDAYDNGLKTLIEAQLALTGDLQARADVEKSAVDADLTKKLDDLALEEAKIRAAKNDRHKTEQLALIEKAKTEEQNAAAAKKELIDRQTAFAIEDRTIEIYKSKVDTQIAELQAQASIASTAQERAALELRILALRQQQERDIEGTRIDRRVAIGELKPEQGGALKANLDNTLSAQAAAAKQQAFLSANPVAAYLHGLEDVNTEMQNAGVTAARDLATGLADAIANAKSLGDVARNVFRQLISQLLADALQRDVTGPILGGLGGFFGFPGHAAGTSYSPGGWHWVGERGPELMNVPTGAQIIPANQTLSALKNMSVPSAAGGLTVIQPFHFHAEGAVMTEELLAQANQQAAGYANQAYVRSLRDGRKALPDALRAHQQLRG